MSNYYDYREVKVMIAKELMGIEGWKVYGYKMDESDSMTDYYSPANWGGIAEKNGYILCVNVHGAAERQEVRKYNRSNSLGVDVQSKIEKLKMVTVEKGATISEEKTAKEKIEALQNKQSKAINDYEVIGYIPAHQAHPSRCNWHIEKDGVIVAKGNGILKYTQGYDYFTYETTKKDMDAFKKSQDNWLNEWAESATRRGYYETVEEAKEACTYRVEGMREKWAAIEAFKKFIKKIDTTCGGMIGSGEIKQYEKVTVTEYKKENKAVECEGSIKDGQCFILKTSFNYGCGKGLVYRIHENEYNGQKYYTAYKLNSKLTKECTGKASQNNSWNTFGDRFNAWIKSGAIAFCRIEEVSTPYEVEKFIKKTMSTDGATPKEADNGENKTIKGEYTYTVAEDVDTRDNTPIYTVKINELLSRDEYLQVSKSMKEFGGYYSRFKHAFIFKEDPSEKLGINQTQPCNIEDVNASGDTVEVANDCVDAVLDEVVSVTFNESMRTIEIRLENAKDSTIELLKTNNYTWLSFVGAYVKDDNAENRRFVSEHFSKYINQAA